MKSLSSGENGVIVVSRQKVQIKRTFPDESVKVGVLIIRMMINLAKKRRKESSAAADASNGYYGQWQQQLYCFGATPLGGLLLYECWLLVSILIEVHYVFSTQQQPAPLIFLSQKKSFLLSIINLIILFFMVLQKMVLKINHFSSGKLIIKAQWALSLIRKGLS